MWTRGCLCQKQLFIPVFSLFSVVRGSEFIINIIFNDIAGLFFCALMLCKQTEPRPQPMLFNSGPSRSVYQRHLRPVLALTFQLRLKGRAYRVGLGLFRQCQALKSILL